MFPEKKKDCYKGVYFKGNFYTKNHELYSKRANQYKVNMTHF